MRMRASSSRSVSGSFVFEKNKKCRASEMSQAGGPPRGPASGPGPEAVLGSPTQRRGQIFTWTSQRVTVSCSFSFKRNRFCLPCVFFGAFSCAVPCRVLVVEIKKDDLDVLIRLFRATPRRIGNSILPKRDD